MQNLRVEKKTSVLPIYKTPEAWVIRNMNSFGNCYISKKMFFEYGQLEGLEAFFGCKIYYKDSKCNPNCCIITNTEKLL